MSIERRVLDIIEGKKKAPLSKALLHLMSQCYRAGTFVRNSAYDLVISPKKLTIPVISVGNVVAGGTGKTPVIHYLANALRDKRVAILSRGYRRSGKKTVVVQQSTSVEECGDEPAFLAKKLPQAQVIVGARRSFSGQIAQSLGAQVILLDDGMQHRKLHRDIEIAVVDGRDPFGKGYFLPRGFLRDSPKRLAHADLIILNGVKNPEDLAHLTERIRHYSQAPIAVMELIVENSVELASKKVAAFCGIAAPNRFIDTLKTLGCDIVLKEEKPDHIPFSYEELERLSIRALDRGAECLVCTEKDAIKFSEQFHLRLPLVVAQIALRPTFGKEHLEKIINEVLQ